MAQRVYHVICDSAGIMYWGDVGLKRIQSAFLNGTGRVTTELSEKDGGASYYDFVLYDPDTIYFTDWLNPYALHTYCICL